MRIIGIDPSMNDTAIAVIRDEPCPITRSRILTRSIKELTPGTYSRIIAEFKYGNDEPITAGFVEDFSNVGGKDTNKNSIKSTSHSGGMAEEALAAAGIPIIPITVNEWRRVALGSPSPHPTKSGRPMRYWTKGDSKYSVPDNVTPRLLEIFDPTMHFSEKADYLKVIDFPYDSRPTSVFHNFLTYLRQLKKPLTSRRIQLVFGITIDELEAAGIALAGMKLIKSGKIEGLMNT